MAFNVIDTDLEYGFEFSVSVEADDDFAIAFFTSSRYRLILSKKHTREVSAAWFESAGNRALVALHECYEIFYIEFPMLYPFASGADARLYIAH